jgi:hypothetical protein
MKAVIGRLSGLIFGFGLALFEIFNPARVPGFLDAAGQRDPSRAFVLAGAVAAWFTGYRRSQHMVRPAFTERFDIRVATLVDGRVLAGAALFGIAWGSAGLCPDRLSPCSASSVPAAFSSLQPW